MGTVYEEITLRNMTTVMIAEKGLTDDAKVPSITVTAVVDTGAGCFVK